MGCWWWSQWWSQLVEEVEERESKYKFNFFLVVVLWVAVGGRGCRGRERERESKYKYNLFLLGAYGRFSGGCVGCWWWWLVK